MKLVHWLQILNLYNQYVQEKQEALRRRKIYKPQPLMILRLITTVTKITRDKNMGDVNLHNRKYKINKMKVAVAFC